MIRNFIFSIFFFTGIIVISLIFLPTYFLPQIVVLFGGKLMGHWTGFCLKIFLSIFAFGGFWNSYSMSFIERPRASAQVKSFSRTFSMWIWNCWFVRPFGRPGLSRIVDSEGRVTFDCRVKGLSQ